MNIRLNCGSKLDGVKPLKGKGCVLAFLREHHHRPFELRVTHPHTLRIVLVFAPVFKDEAMKCFSLY